MKIILEFDDSKDYDERKRAKRAQSADDCYAVLWDLIHAKLRTKHLEGDVVDIYEDISAYIFKQMDNRGISFSDYE